MYSDEQVQGFEIGTEVVVVQPGCDYFGQVLVVFSEPYINWPKAEYKVKTARGKAIIVCDDQDRFRARKVQLLNDFIGLSPVREGDQQKLIPAFLALPVSWLRPLGWDEEQDVSETLTKGLGEGYGVG